MMFRFVSSFVASAAIVFLAATLLGHAISPAQPKIIATVVAHAHADPAWVATAVHGL